MKLVRILAVALTALMALMNLGVALDPGEASALEIVAGAVLFVLGAAAAAGLATARSWGRTAVIAVAGLNLVAAVAALAAGVEGAAIGIVVSLAGGALGWFSHPRPAPALA